MNATKPSLYEEVKPAKEAVNLQELLGEIRKQITDHVSLEAEAATALAVWVVHTYVFKERHAVAYVAIQSPEKRCGKTTLLSVLAGMAAKTIVASNISVGALFRAIDEAGPTLMIDEADTFLGRSSAMRGILNCGNTRKTAYVLRLAGKRANKETAAEDQEAKEPSSLEKFSCWCPKVIAMIGHVPETIADRSIVVNMTRKLTSEKLLPLAGFDPSTIVSKCARWAQDCRCAVRDHPRMELDDVSDRASDTFEPLLVIADMAGEEELTSLTDAARKLCSHENTEPEGASLLLDMMSIFIQRPSRRVFSREIPEKLQGASGWAVYDASSREPLSEIGVARVLRRYGIKPMTVRIDDEVGRGYKWEQFERALEHYVSKPEIKKKLEELKQMAELAIEAHKDADAKAKVAAEGKIRELDAKVAKREEAFKKKAVKLDKEEAKVINEIAKSLVTQAASGISKMGNAGAGEGE